MTEQSIFLAALDIGDPTDRLAYVDKACGEDSALRRQVMSLLAAHERSGEFLDVPAVEQIQPNDYTAAYDCDAGKQIGQVGSTQVGPDDKHAESEDVGEPNLLGFLLPSIKPGSLGRLGHYEVLKLLGQGGFGIVLKGFDERLHRVVAIKVLSPAYSASGPARKRFSREARAAAAVKNEHVVGIHDVQEDVDPPFLVMELVDGISLQDKIDAHGPLDIKEILRIGMQTAEGLAAAHKQGLVHRDIKPANILLENGVERVKISDFGLARAVDDASLTQSGVVAGTPMYMSPEQAEGLPIDHRSDLFSLGTVLYAMCTGHPPFRASGTHAVLKRVIEASPRPIREINSDIPEWLCNIIAKLHAKKPEDRFQTAKKVAELFAQHLAHLQQPASAPAPAPVVVPARNEPASTMRKLLEASDRTKHLLQLGLTLAALALLFTQIPPTPGLGFPAMVGGIIIYVILLDRVRQRWSADYRGHTIRFEYSCVRGGSLFIDSVRIARGGIGFHSEIRGVIPSGQGAGETIVVLADIGVVFDCQILVESGAMGESTRTARIASRSRNQRWLLGLVYLFALGLLLDLALLSLCVLLGLEPEPYQLAAALVLLLAVVVLGSSGLMLRSRTRRRRAFLNAAVICSAMAAALIFLSYLEYLLFPGYGELVVECDDPEVRIHLEGDTKGSFPHAAIDQYVPPGRHRVPRCDMKVTPEMNGTALGLQSVYWGNGRQYTVHISTNILKGNPQQLDPDKEGWRPLPNNYSFWKSIVAGDSSMDSVYGATLWPGATLESIDKMPKNFHLRMEVMLGAQEREHLFGDGEPLGVIRFRGQPLVDSIQKSPPKDGRREKAAREIIERADGWFITFSESEQPDMIDGKMLAAVPGQQDAVVSARGLGKFDDWFRLEIIAKGKHVDVLVDGKNVMSLTNDDEPTRGTISLWNQRRQRSNINFRKMEIKELPAEESSSATNHD
jgi:serine/threonine protein kinase